MSTLPVPPEMFDDFTVKRYAAGSYSSGGWSPGSESQVTITASIQPAGPNELINLPEAQRTKAAIKAYTNDELRTANEGSSLQADRIVYNSEDWEVQKVSQHEFGIAHYKAIAVRLDRS